MRITMAFFRDCMSFTDDGGLERCAISAEVADAHDMG